MRIQLKQTYLVTGAEKTLVLTTPIALGSSAEAMPPARDGETVAQLVLEDPQIAGCQALIVERQGAVVVLQREGATGLRVNGVATDNLALKTGDFIQVGRYQLQVDLNPPETDFPETGTCDRQVGFLVRKRCGRTRREGCPYCDAGHPNNDPYYYDRAYYPGYGSYRSGWGYDYYAYRDSYVYDPTTGSVDFTEADGASLGRELDGDFEQDMGAS